MNTETETKVAQVLDMVIAPYQRELMALTPGERILLACGMSEICRVVSMAVERAKAQPVNSRMV